MEEQNIFNFLIEASDSKFVTRKWKFLNDQSDAKYDVWNKNIFNTEVLKSNPSNYNDGYILLRDITANFFAKKFW